MHAAAGEAYHSYFIWSNKNTTRGTNTQNGIRKEKGYFSVTDTLKGYFFYNHDSSTVNLHKCYSLKTKDTGNRYEEFVILITEFCWNL